MDYLEEQSQDNDNSGLQQSLVLKKKKKILKKVNKDCNDLLRKQQIDALVPFQKIKKKKKNELMCKKQQFQIHRVLKNSSSEGNLTSFIEEEGAIIIYTEEKKDAKKYREFPQIQMFKPIFQSRIYHLAGDILVEPRFPRNKEEEIQNGQILNHFKNVVSVENNKNFLTFSMDSVRPLKLFDEVIHCLENSQDASNYQYAMTLREYQQTVFLVQELIQQVIDQYDSNPSDLQKLLKQREEYMISCEKKLIEQLSAEGAFACVRLLNLSFSNKAWETIRLSFTKNSIAMLGVDFETALTHFMRKGFMDFFNHSSRRMIFRTTLESYQDKKKKTIYNLPSFEVITIDGIKLICDGELEAQPVEFPEKLRFKGAQVNKLNDLEVINIFRFKISPEQINSVMIMRSDKQPQDARFEQQTEILSFEYSMISSIFLEKHYPAEYESLCKLSNKNNQKKECGFRYLNELKDNPSNLMEEEQEKTSVALLDL